MEETLLTQTENPEATPEETPESEAPEQPAGAPESYDFTPSLSEGMELDEEVAKEFGDICRELNLTNEQANKLAAYGYGYAAKGIEGYVAQRNAEVSEWGETAKKELGADFDKVVNVAAIGVETLEKTVPGIKAALNETGAGNRIEIIRAMEMLGRLVQEDTARDVGGENQNVKSMYPARDFSKY